MNVWLQEAHVDLLDHTGTPPLHVAAAGGQLHVAEELLQRSAVVDLRTCAATAAARALLSCRLRCRAISLWCACCSSTTQASTCRAMLGTPP